MPGGWGARCAGRAGYAFPRRGRMRKGLLLGAGLAMVAAVSVGAQGAPNSCASGQTQDACQMAVDVFRLVSPQLGLALAGGNATLGRGSTLGGPGHFSIGLRANFFEGD